MVSVETSLALQNNFGRDPPLRKNFPRPGMYVHVDGFMDSRTWRRAIPPSIRALQWLHDGVRVGREFDKKVHSRNIRIPVLLRHKKPRRMQKVALPSCPFLFSPPLEFSFAFYVQTGFSSPIFFSSRHEMCIPEYMQLSS